MKLEEVISVPAYHSPVECDEAFQMKVMVEGKTTYYEPVDFRLNMIHVPLRTGDIDIIYNKSTKEGNIYKNDVITKIYYPPSTKITMVDGSEFIVLSYGPIKRYKDMSRVTVYCKPASEEYTLIETIPNKPVLDKILKEMNNILISNEELKKLLSQYSYNWMLYNETKVDDRTEAAAHRILDTISFLEYQKQFAQQTNFKSLLETNYEMIPKSSINEMYQYAVDFTRKRYPIYYNNVVKMFRMSAIATWLIYIAENINKNIDYEDIYFLNKNQIKTKIDISVGNNPVVGSDIQYDFLMPSESKYNYTIRLYQVAGHLEYPAYNIDVIRLFQINKETSESVELVNASMQKDNFEAFVRILEILSGYGHDFLVSDWYANIDELIDEMDVSKPTVVEDDTDRPIDESEEQKLDRIISEKIDDRILPKVTEILRAYILEGSLNLVGGDADDYVSSGDSVTSENDIVYTSL